MVTDSESAPQGGAVWLHFGGDRGRGYPLTQIPVRGAPGRLYAGPVPGRMQLSLLAPHLQLIAGAGVNRVLCLLHPSDLDPVYGRGGYVNAAREVFRERFELLPIRDYDLPGDPGAFTGQIRKVNAALEAGESQLIHCAAGCGRAGLFAASLLTARGLEPAEAIRVYRAARGCGPETADQIAYVARFNRLGLG